MGSPDYEEEVWMRRIFALIIAVGLMAALLALPATASAKAEFTEYTGTEYAAGWPIDQVFRQSGPILHYSHVGYYYDDTSDWRTTGDTTVVMNFTGRDFMLPTMNGHIWGTFRTELRDSDGVWEGTWTGKMIDGLPFFKAVGHGSGVLDGLKMKAYYHGTSAGTIGIEGRILDPHGS